MAPQLRAHQHDLREFKEMVHRQELRVKSSMCSVWYCTEAVKALGLILFYYVFSIGLTFYNQRLFHKSPLTLSITMCHFVFKFIAASLLRLVLECRNKEERVVLDWETYVKRVGIAGIVGALDIGLSNWSFVFVTVSLYTMSKSTAVIFILFFSLIFRLEKFRWSLVIVVLLIFLGLFLFTFKSTQFNVQGFVLVMIASVLSGLRWTLAQIVLQKNEIGLHNPLDMMYHIQPWMIIGLFPLSASLEGLSVSASSQMFGFYDWETLFQSMGAILLGAFLGFMLEFSEFLLLSHTSSLTLSIAGIFKELGVFGLAIQINHDPMSLINGLGMLVCVLGIIVHVISKAVHGKEDKIEHDLQEAIKPMEMNILLKDGEANQNDSESDEVDLFVADRTR